MNEQFVKLLIEALRKHADEQRGQLSHSTRAATLYDVARAAETALAAMKHLEHEQSVKQAMGSSEDY